METAKKNTDATACSSEEERREVILSPLESEVLEGFRACGEDDRDVIVFLARRATLQKKGRCGNIVAFG